LGILPLFPDVPADVSRRFYSGRKRPPTPSSTLIHEAPTT
jgi:hypothetical protein